jgi:multidrug efflux pump subunit AcrA (membrane-fusion protein)
VNVNVIVDTVPGAVMVPEGAVQFGKQGPYLFAVSKDGKADMRPVTPGVRFNNLIQITEGVAAGEDVVVLGQLMLFPGAPVMDTSKMPPGGMPPGAGAAGKPGGK